MRNIVTWVSLVTLCSCLILFMVDLYLPKDSALQQLSSQVIALVGVAGAIVAAVATWKAAQEAAISATIAKASMEASANSARETLSETQKFNRKNSFENRYAVLLEQHNIYHDQLCNYIDKNKKIETSDVFNIFVKAFTPDGLKNSFETLTGHEIISRYMRTLYHLMKYVDESFFTKHDDLKSKKEYISPLRSIIRNDILYLISVNALNVLADHNKLTGYPKYQKLLHKFSFFEHAIFLYPFEPHRLSIGDQPRDVLVKLFPRYYDYSYLIKHNISDTGLNLPPIPLTPVLLCLIIYDNPMKTSALKMIEDLNTSLLNSLVNEANNWIESHEKSTRLLKQVQSWHYRCRNDEHYRPVSKRFFRIMGSMAFQKKNWPSNSYYFKNIEEDTSYATDGKLLIEHIESVIKNKKLYQYIHLCGGANKFSEHVDSSLEIKKKQLISEVYSYKVTCEDPIIN